VWVVNQHENAVETQLRIAPGLFKLEQILVIRGKSTDVQASGSRLDVTIAGRDALVLRIQPAQ